MKIKQNEIEINERELRALSSGEPSLYNAMMRLSSLFGGFSDCDDDEEQEEE